MLTEVPFLPKKKINEWAKKPMYLGVLAGLNAMVWGILTSYWLGLI